MLGSSFSPGGYSGLEGFSEKEREKKKKQQKKKKKEKTKRVVVR